MAMLLLGVLMLTSCSDDGSDDAPQDGNLRLLSVTRTDDTHAHVTSGGIRMFVTTADGTPNPGGFAYSDEPAPEWTSSGFSLKENTQYYFYGYWPNDDDVVSTGSTVSAAAADLNGDYSKGADLAMYDLPPFTTQDILVIVGVGKADGAQTADATHTTPTEGNYEYFAGLAGNNYVNLLMDHLYTQLQLQFCVDKNYYALRRIELTSVKLMTSYAKTVTATVHLRSGQKPGLGNVEYSVGTAGCPTPHELLKSTDPHVTLVEAPAEGAEDPVYTVFPQTGTDPVCCSPCLFSGDNLSVETTYNVYTATDKTTENPDGKGSLVRENCTATNKITVTTTAAAPGMKKKFTLTVAPTYLYVLADPDLDNPTIRLN